jgi:C1A family cysteine protease
MKSLLFLGAALFAGNALKDMDWRTEFKNEDLKDLDTHAVFESWHKYFERNYPTEVEEAHRYAIWLENLNRIGDYNSRNLTFTLRLNQFGDLTGDEFRLKVHGTTGSCLSPNGKRREPIKQQKSEPNLNIPASVDWTTQGVVTPVKNQGDCGSCWAFSTTGSMECDYAIKTGQLISLSEQQLVDCSSSYGNDGCNGGWYYYAWEYAVADGGLCTEAAYPYVGVQQACKAASCGPKYDPPKTYSKVTADDAQALMNSAAVGCVSVAIEANQFAFQYYSGGVLTGTCGTTIDHAVLVVGYGTESGQSYWKVKNSWGTDWGEEGYVLICNNCGANGAEGECGIDMYPAYPVF